MDIQRTAIWLTAGIFASILPMSASTTPVRQGVSLDIDVSTPVSLREPVVLKYVVLNESVRPVVADLGYDRAGALEFELTGPGGERQIARPRLRFVDGESSARSSKVTIAPGGRYEQRIVLDEWLRFDNAGAYVLQVRFFGVLAFSSGIAADAARTAVVDGGLQPPSATVTSPDRTFHVLILPRDERRLEESLRANRRGSASWTAPK